jgi:hypothetical protein
MDVSFHLKIDMFLLLYIKNFFKTKKLDKSHLFVLPSFKEGREEFFISLILSFLGAPFVP